MSKKTPKEFVPMYSANLTAGFAFLHLALKAVTIAFLAGGK